MFRTRLIRPISKSNQFPLVLQLLDFNSVVSKTTCTLLKVFSNCAMGSFVGSDDHIMHVVINRNWKCMLSKWHKFTGLTGQSCYVQDQL